MPTILERLNVAVRLVVVLDAFPFPKSLRNGAAGSVRDVSMLHVVVVVLRSAWPPLSTRRAPIRCRRRRLRRLELAERTTITKNPERDELYSGIAGVDQFAGTSWISGVGGEFPVNGSILPFMLKWSMTTAAAPQHLLHHMNVMTRPSGSFLSYFPPHSRVGARDGEIGFRGSPPTPPDPRWCPREDLRPAIPE